MAALLLESELGEDGTGIARGHKVDVSGDVLARGVKLGCTASDEDGIDSARSKGFRNQGCRLDQVLAHISRGTECLQFVTQIHRALIMVYPVPQVEPSAPTVAGVVWGGRTFRAAQGIRAIEGRLYDSTGKMVQEFKNSYAADGTYVRRRAVYEDGTVIEDGPAEEEPESSR